MSVSTLLQLAKFLERTDEDRTLGGEIFGALLSLIFRVILELLYVTKTIGMLARLLDRCACFVKKNLLIAHPQFFVCSKSTIN